MHDHQAYMREWMRKHRRDHPEAVTATSRAARARARERLWKLKEGPCSDCGGTFHPSAMQFDHRDPTTKFFGISDQFKASLSRLMTEVAKCDLVCANCHAIRTWKTNAVASQTVENRTVNPAQ